MSKLRIISIIVLQLMSAILIYLFVNSIITDGYQLQRSVGQMEGSEGMYLLIRDFGGEIPVSVSFTPADIKVSDAYIDPIYIFLILIPAIFCFCISQLLLFSALFNKKRRAEQQ